MKSSHGLRFQDGAFLHQAVAAMAYGWLVSPVTYIDTSPDTLRIDYKTDYVLMVAEAYTTERDLDTAVRRLASLGNRTPAAMVMNAIQFAQEQGYTQADIQRMQDLLTAIQSANISSGGAP